MDIEKVNAVLSKAIVVFQAEEIERLVEAAFSVPSPSEMHAKYGMTIPANIGPHGLPSGAKDVTKKTIEDAVYSLRRYGMSSGGFDFNPRSVEVKGSKKKLNKSQQVVIRLVGKGLDLAFISGVIFYDDAFKNLKKNEKKAVLSLLMGGRLKLYKVPGPLPGVHKPSRIGAMADYYYRMVSA